MKGRISRQAPKHARGRAPLRWLSIFPALASEHIPKDVMLLPGALTRSRRINQVDLVAKSPPPEAPKSGLRLIASRHPLWYLVLKSRDYDVLHLFHLKWESVLLGLAFKLRNPRGRLYVKLDADAFIEQQVSTRRRWRKPRVSDLVYILADRLSCETTTIYRLLIAKGWSQHKLLLLPNGIESDTRALLAAEKSARVQTILTVGRLGTEQKNTERLIRSYGALPAHLRQIWSLTLVGPIEPSHEQALRDLATSACCGGGEVNFVGRIADRASLCELYGRASIFVLPSRWESSGLVLIEALFAGLYSLATPVGCAPDLLSDPQLGTLLPEEDSAFGVQLQQALTIPRDPKAIKQRAARLVRDWDDIADTLIDAIII